MLLACIDAVDCAFPSPADPDRYEALAHVFQLAAYRQKQHADMLRAHRAGVHDRYPATRRN